MKSRFLLIVTFFLSVGCTTLAQTANFPAKTDVSEPLSSANKYLVEVFEIVEKNALNRGKVDLSEYLDFADAARQIGHFIEEVYMTKRMHSALGYLTPAEFELAFRLAQTQDSQVPPKNPLTCVQFYGSTTMGLVLDSLFFKSAPFKSFLIEKTTSLWFLVQSLVAF